MKRISIKVAVYFLSLLSAAGYSYAWQSEQAGDSPSSEEDTARKALAKRFPGEIIFDSNRSGSFGLYAIGADGSSIRTIIDGPEHEMYPDVSADGKWITFSKTASLERDADSEVFVAERDGKNARLLAPNGTFSTFSQDGASIYFERKRRKVMRVDLATGGIEEIFPKDSNKFRGRFIVKPRLSPNEKFIAFTSNLPDRWHAWFANLETGNATIVGRGCEPTWFASGAELAWISRGDSRGGAGVYSFAKKSAERTVLEDADTPFSHEYFPTLTSDGQFLLFSAAPASEHSHFASNYQIFVKDIGSNERIRVTFDGYNNRWPRLLRPSAPT